MSSVTCNVVNNTGFAVTSQSRNRTLAHAVAAREFGKRCALRPSSASLGLLRVGQFRRSAHVLPALLRPAAALGGAGADKVPLHTSAKPPNTARRSATAPPILLTCN